MAKMSDWHCPRCHISYDKKTLKCPKCGRKWIPKQRPVFHPEIYGICKL